MSPHLFRNYASLDVTFSHGEGVWLWDTEGNKYLDALAGIAVSTLGHAHPRLVQAISEQAGRYLHCSNIYRIPEQEQLAEKLCQISGMQRAFLCNSGTEANEAAIKLARLHGHARNIDNPTMIVTDGAFHGRTLAALAATANPKSKIGFDPLPERFLRVPFGDAEAVAALASDAQVCAVLVEPIQGEGGINIPPAGYLKALREICDANGWLLIFDEVQSGIARSGLWFACQHENVLPDAMCLAKGLGGGVPIGALLAQGKAAEYFGPGSHGSTFGGNPLASSAALAVLNTIEAEGLCAAADSLGKYLLEAFATRLAGAAGIKDIRGRGLLLAIELDRPCGDLVKRALNAGLLINVTANQVIRLLPPLIMTQAEAKQLVESLCPLIEDFLKEDAT